MKVQEFCDITLDSLADLLEHSRDQVDWKVRIGGLFGAGYLKSIGSKSLLTNPLVRQVMPLLQMLGAIDEKGEEIDVTGFIAGIENVLRVEKSLDFGLFALDEKDCKFWLSKLKEKSDDRDTLFRRREGQVAGSSST